MQVQNNTPAFTARQIQITKANNPEMKYLYNKVIDIINETPVPATVHNKGIDINPASGFKKITKILEDLDKAGIKYLDVQV